MALAPWGPEAAGPDYLALVRALIAQRGKSVLPAGRDPGFAGPTDVGLYHPRFLGPPQQMPPQQMPPMRVPGPTRKYFTYARDAGVQPGQQLRFTPSLGYWVSQNPGGYRPF